MELHLALKEIVEKEGTSILTEPRLVNILADYNAYEKYPACKFIVKSLIESNTVDDIQNFDAERYNVELSLTCMIEKVYASFGYDKQLVSYVLRSLSYSLNLIDNMSEATETNFSLDDQMNGSKSSSGKHLSFKGVSFDNTVENFVCELEKKGCSRYLLELENVGIFDMRGSFGQYTDCRINLSYTCLSHKVWGIDVYIDLLDEDTQIYNYEELISFYTEKYGVPLKKIKRKDFISNTFEMVYGSIRASLIIENNSIVLYYSDTLNSELRDAEKKKQIMQDI